MEFTGELALIQQRLAATPEMAERRRSVIGALAASDWCQSSFGSLIDEVVQYRARGVPIAVITEEHWTSALP